MRPTSAGGPAFLAYYAPAFVKLAASEEISYEKVTHRHDRCAVIISLRLLTETFRAARRLWPRSSEGAGRTVTLHLGQIKGEPVSTILGAHQEGDCWVLVQRSENEAVVERHALQALLEGKVASGSATLLHFWSSQVSKHSDELLRAHTRLAHPSQMDRAKSV